MNLEWIHEIAEGELLGKRSHSWKEPGNKFHHGERVARIALELRRLVLGVWNYVKNSRKFASGYSVA